MQLPFNPANAPRHAVVRPARGNPVIESYAALLKSARAAGLMRRRRTFYAVVFAVLLLLLAAAGTGFVLLGQTWLQLLIAAALGILFTQFAFLAHEAAHHQVFASGQANDWTARILGPLLVGMSYAMWVKKHTAHHQNPNTKGKDPDIHTGVVAFHEEGAATKRGFAAVITRHQGTLLFPLILFLGFSLVVDSAKTLFGRRGVRYRYVEIGLLVLRFGVYLAVLLLMLPWEMALAFLAVQMGVFGFYMGASFAPNHKGMPVLEAGSRADYLTRQVVTSRNIRGGLFMDTLMGGLNRQVEHHLFPDMARPELRRANALVRQACESNGIVFTETGLMQSYAIVVRYLNRVGLSAVDPFECPLVRQFR
ncbi:putative fatty acid desaturase [Arthrobacter sp. PAMC 25486]|uniref:fatty acid desaturase family protein n=1 Tax=Arthrobacter sp. PAMC 25486 TaxID=1494608 RepID=UPI000535A8CA|nr:acyl-CoA desaturase [Arthrobacter sp. PAMC 25486]AIY02543.1 putative fatty acid desaturase [Arthrobacter sp. PAMC 25486]